MVHGETSRPLNGTLFGTLQITLRNLGLAKEPKPDDAIKNIATKGPRLLTKGI